MASWDVAAPFKYRPWWKLSKAFAQPRSSNPVTQSKRRGDRSVTKFSAFSMMAGSSGNQTARKTNSSHCQRVFVAPESKIGNKKLGMKCSGGVSPAGVGINKALNVQPLTDF
jgi:hypothetical protein